jgi:hypothetical protein
MIHFDQDQLQSIFPPIFGIGSKFNEKLVLWLQIIKSVNIL